MGLFSSKSTNENTVTNQTTNNMADNRVGAADNATALVGGDGSTLTINNTQNNQVVDPAALTALSVSIDGSLDAITGLTSSLVDGVADAQGLARDMGRDAQDSARELFEAAAGIQSEALAAAQRSMGDALASNERITSEGFGFGRDALDFAEVTQTQLADLVDTFGDRLAHENDDNRAYSSSLVGSVLQQARTSDERNIQEFLTAAKWIVGFVVVAFVAPKVFGK